MVQPLDFEVFSKGTIPWSAEEYLEVMEWYEQLQSTPKDDWDLTEQGFMIENEDGKIKKLKFNSFRAVTQLGFFMAKRYPKGEMPYHTGRFMQINEFLSKFISDLKNDGLAESNEGEFEKIRYEVIQALCVLPYSKREIVEGQEHHSFDYDEVVAKARELIEAKDSE